MLNLIVDFSLPALTMHIGRLISRRRWQCDAIQCSISCCCCCRCQVAGCRCSWRCGCIECGQQTMLMLGSWLQVYRMILNQRLMMMSNRIGRGGRKWKVYRSRCWRVAIWWAARCRQWQRGCSAETQQAAWHSDEILRMLLLLLSR